MNDEIKQFPVRINAELYKKLKVKATAKELSVNKYVTSLIADAVDDVDLSALLGE